VDIRKGVKIHSRGIERKGEYRGTRCEVIGGNRISIMIYERYATSW
jgi:hypothetical protein